MASKTRGPVTLADIIGRPGEKLRPVNREEAQRIETLERLQVVSCNLAFAHDVDAARSLTQPAEYRVD